MERCYEQTLREFAEGKRLGRLAKAVRDPSDAACDACGSTLPRTLLGLRDGNSGRYYFVGQNCLGWLLANGLDCESESDAVDRWIDEAITPAALAGAWRLAGDLLVSV